jgi:hypothetical protein
MVLRWPPGETAKRPLGGQSVLGIFFTQILQSMKHHTPPRKRYRDMDLAELEAATKQYDKPCLHPKPLAVPKAIRAADRRIRKGK